MSRTNFSATMARSSLLCGVDEPGCDVLTEVTVFEVSALMLHVLE